MPNKKIAPPGPPAVVAGLPGRVMRRLDPEDALRNAVWAQPPTPPGPYMAFADIRSTLIAAGVQQRRIARAKKLLSAHRGRVQSRSHGMLFFDVHFYVLCCARIAKQAEFLARHTRFRRVGLVLRRYHTDLRAISTFRDQLEHFEERLPGGSGHRSLRAPGDLFTISGDRASIGGDQLDIGRGGYELLKAFVTELQQAVLSDSAELLAVLDPSRLKLVIDRAALSLHVERTQRTVQRALRERRTSSSSQTTPSNQGLHPTPAGKSCAGAGERGR